MTDLVASAPATSFDDEEILACLKRAGSKNPWLRVREIRRRLNYAEVEARALEDHLLKMARQQVIRLHRDGDIPQFRSNP